MLWAIHPNYNRPENKSEMTNNDQICAQPVKKYIGPWFYHIKYDEQYMPEMFLTLPELQHKRIYQFLMILWWAFDDFTKTLQNPKS